MSRPSATTAAQRNLTLTEELERLEQQITLTLQEIDHNFSRAHRIVTSSILPVVEKYREHSSSVWEGSQFWKQFFEASANVSLSGYEEPPPEGQEGRGEEDGEVEGDTITASSSMISGSAQTATPSTASTYGASDDHRGGGRSGDLEGENDDMTITPSQDQTYSLAGELSPSPAHSTPRPPYAQKSSNHMNSATATTAPFSSPYEDLKSKTFGHRQQPSTPGDVFESASSPSPSPSKTKRPNASAIPASSPFAPPSTFNPQRTATGTRTPANDPLLHRVLDKNWRVGATPHSAAKSRSRFGQSKPTMEETPKQNTARRTQVGRSRTVPDDDDLDFSSPAEPAPQLHAELFDTPVRAGRVPGVSVLTPGRNLHRDGEKRTRDQPDRKVMGAVPRNEGAGKDSGRSLWPDDMWDSDEEIDLMEGVMSPPKTMQFHVPQSRLVQTPAREASKRIVEDLLLTAGMNDGLDGAESEDSPSIVKRGEMLEEDTF